MSDKIVYVVQKEKHNRWISSQRIREKIKILQEDKFFQPGE